MEVPVAIHGADTRVIAAAAILGALAGFASDGSLSLAKLHRFSVSTYKPIWTHAKWSLAGVLTTELQARSYIYIVTALAGAEALGTLAAGVILFRPIGTLMTAWGRIARPLLAKAATTANLGRFVRIIINGLLLLVLATFGTYVLLYALWSVITTHLYGEKYTDMALIIQFWGAIVFIQGLREVVIVAMNALLHFRPLALAIAIGGIVASLSVPVFFFLFDFRAALLGVLLGEVVTLLLISHRLFASLRSRNFGINDREGDALNQ